MGPSHTIEPARREELEPAFQLLFQHLATQERCRRVAAALELARTGQFDSRGILIARAGERLVGVLVCQPAPGASALLWPPYVLECPEKNELADELVRRGCLWLRQKGTKLAHALLTDEEVPRAGPLERNGLRRITTLWYLRHPLDALPAQSGRLHYHAYPAADPSVFRQILLRTYEETLDCPEINHVRDAAEILAGYEAQGRHDPARWWLARDGAAWVGVLLLADVPALGGWDLSYLGVIPEARRRGVGRELTCKALWEARQAGTAQLSLAVDERNTPAWALYEGLGFAPFDRRAVYLAIWSPVSNGVDAC